MSQKLDAVMDDVLEKMDKVVSFYIREEQIQAILTEVLSAKLGCRVNVEMDSHTLAHIEAKISLGTLTKALHEREA